MEKCYGYVIFIRIKDLNIDENDGDNYFSITLIDEMAKPEETIRFYKSTHYANRNWIQDGYPRCKDLKI